MLSLNGLTLPWAALLYYPNNGFRLFSENGGRLLQPSWIKIDPDDLRIRADPCFIYLFTSRVLDLVSGKLKVKMASSENTFKPTVRRVGNIQIYTERDSQCTYDSFEDPSFTYAYSLPKKCIKPEDFVKLGIIKTKGPANTNFASFDSRLESFHSWPKKDILRSKKLAKAGFYYTGVDDQTLCYYCQVGLKNWQSHHDPRVEHSHWSEQCFMNAVNKEKVVDNVNGLNTHTMKEIGKKQQEMDIDIDMNCHDMTLKCFSSPDSSFSNHNVKLCCLCQSREKSVVFLPCGHFAACHQCTVSLSKCAACKKPFKGLVCAKIEQ